MQNLRLTNESYQGAGAETILIPSYADPGSLINVSWCGSGITADDVTDINAGGGWSISDACGAP